MNIYNFCTDFEMIREEKEEYKENMYLLYPLQIFNLRRNIKKISNSNKTKAYKEFQMIELYKELITLRKKL